MAMHSGGVPVICGTQPTVSESDSNPQLLGNTPQPTGRMSTADKSTNMWGFKTVSVKQRGKPLKKQPMEGGGSSPPSSPDCSWADSNGFSTTSKAKGGRWRCRRCRRCRNNKCLAPACLDMPIFKTIYSNMDITYTIWNLT